MAVFTTAVICFLCKTNVPYNKSDNSRLISHLEGKHAASYGTDYLVAGCTMSGEERVAIQNVVKTRQPKLVQIQADHDKKEEGVVTIDDDSTSPASKPVSTLNTGSSNGKVITKSGLVLSKTVASSKEGKTVITPVVTSSRGMKCPDCDFSCKLQVQMNRHKNVCTKDKPNDGQSPKVKKWKMKLLSEAAAAKTVKSSVKTTKTPEILPNGKVKKPRKSPYAEPGKGHPCNDCGKEFRNESILKAHQEDVHQSGEFPCPGDKKLCGKVFSSRNKMSSHYSRNCNPNNPIAAAAIEKRRASLG